MHSENMNILFLTKELPYPPNNGHRNRSFHMLRGLAKKHDVALICFGDKEGGKDRTGLGEYCSSITYIPLKKPQGKIGFFFSVLGGIFSGFPHAIASRYSLAMQEAVESLLKDGKADLIVCDSVYQSVHMPKHARVKTILAEHNIESLIIYRYFKTEKNIFKKIYAFMEWTKFRSFEDKTWPLFDKCLVVSEPEKQEISRRTNQRNIEVIPNGVDTVNFNFNRGRENPNSLIYMGQMNWHPNIDAVVYFLNKVFPLIRKQVSEATLYILGHNPPEKIGKLAEQNNAIITGFVEDVRPYVAQSAVFVVPLRIASGTRLKILEAMAMGKAVVSTGIGCEGLDVTDGKNIVIADKPDEFAESVIKLLQNPSLRKQIGSAARQLVEEQYSWDKIMGTLNMAINGYANN